MLTLWGLEHLQDTNHTSSVDPQKPKQQLKHPMRTPKIIIIIMVVVSGTPENLAANLDTLQEPA